MRISDWSSDVCSSDLAIILFGFQGPTAARMGKPERVDLFRLMRATKSLADQSDYLEYAALTFDLGLPSETKTVLAAGTSAGKIASGRADAPALATTAQALTSSADSESEWARARTVCVRKRK